MHTIFYALQVAKSDNNIAALSITYASALQVYTLSPVLSTCYNHFIPIVGVGKIGEY